MRAPFLLALGALLFTLLPTRGLDAQPTPRRRATPETAPLLLQRDVTDRRALLRGDPATNATRLFYRSTRDAISQIEIAAGSRYTAAIETVDGEVGEDGEYRVLPRNRLIVLDPRGRIVRQVDADVQTYTWSPDGQRLAYVVGTYYEGGFGFVPEGMHVLNVESGTTTSVPTIEQPYELHWLATDTEDAIFARTLSQHPAERVKRYDLKSRTVRPVPSGAFHHSPDGRYFLKQPYELIEEGQCQRDQDCLRIIERTTGRTVTLPPREDRGKALGWVPGRGHQLLFSSRQQTQQEQLSQRGNLRLREQRTGRVESVRNLVWDVERSRVVSRFEGIPMIATRQTLDGEWIGDSSLLRILPTDAPRDLRRLQFRRPSVP